MRTLQTYLNRWDVNSLVTFLPSHQHVYDWAPVPHPQQEGNEKDRTKGIGASPTTGPRQDGLQFPLGSSRMTLNLELLK